MLLQCVKTGCHKPSEKPTQEPETGVTELGPKNMLCMTLIGFGGFSDLFENM